MSEPVRICALSDLADGAASRIDHDGHRLAVVRFGDEVFVIGDRCSHADVSLAEGEVDAEEREIECWKHGATFSLVSGEPQCLPATKPVPTYAVTIDGDDVKVVLA